MKNPVTTVTGILIALATIVFSIGLITQEQQMAIVDAIPVLAGVVGSLIAVFKASDKNSDKSGI